MWLANTGSGYTFFTNIRNALIAQPFFGGSLYRRCQDAGCSSLSMEQRNHTLPDHIVKREYKLPFGKDDYLTIGGQILYDKAGSAVLTATHVPPTINYHKSLSSEKNRYISLGFMGGLVQRRVDQSKMTTNSQFDGTVFNPALGTVKHSPGLLTSTWTEAWV